MAQPSRKSANVRNRKSKESKRPKLVVEQYTYFQNTIFISGWTFFDEGEVDKLWLKIDANRKFELNLRGIPRPDVEAHFSDRRALYSGFSGRFEYSMEPEELFAAELVVRASSGESYIFSDLGSVRDDPAHSTAMRFSEECRSLPQTGTLLEIGSRARSGITRREYTPSGWNYLGVDILPGPNVDIVGDAHTLSSIVPPNSIDAVMAFSVLEHILMPWKLVLELNRVMKAGAKGLFMTHQSWPLHDQPWDFWRFSDRAWDALLNRATGFRIVEAKIGEFAHVVPVKMHRATAFVGAPASALASSVMFEKISDTDLSWPVALEDCLATDYPKIVQTK